MKSKITAHLIANPSYLKWGAERLARKYGCSVRTISNILKTMTRYKREYLRSLNY